MNFPFLIRTIDTASIKGCITWRKWIIHPDMLHFRHSLLGRKRNNKKVRMKRAPRDQLRDRPYSQSHRVFLSHDPGLHWWRNFLLLPPSYRRYGWRDRYVSEFTSDLPRSYSAPSNNIWFRRGFIQFWNDGVSSVLVMNLSSFLLRRMVSKEI